MAVYPERQLWKQRIAEVLSRRERRVISQGSLTPSAVLVPIYENGGEHYIVLTKRTRRVEHHKGQVSFPGGAYEDGDSDLQATALRESFEEIGVRGEDVEVLGNLDDQVTSTNFAITPFVGAMPYPYEFNVNRWEVDTLIEAPVSALLDPANFDSETTDDEGRVHPYAYYRYGGHRITGITAMMLQQLLDLVFQQGE
jgi:8-oxo-dGTP pyrophosphatase MutT (NUDIX family)